MFKPKLLAASAIALLAVTMTGCASATPTAPAGADAERSIADCTVTMIPKSTDNPYFAAVHTGFIQASEELGGKLEYVGPAAGEVTAQIQRIQSAGQQKSCAIGIAALDATAVAPSLDAAAKSGTKIVAWDGDVAEASRGIFVNMATAEALGESQFEILAEAMGDAGQWAIISSQSTADSKNLWIDAMNEMAKDPKYSGMELVKTTFGDDDSKKSYDLAVSLIRAYPELKGIMAPTPVALEASVKAVNDLGVQDQIVVTGLGNPGNDAELLTSGQVPAYVLWSPVDLGYLTYYATAAYIEGAITGAEGETFDAGRLGEKTIGANGEIIMGDPVVYTKDNVEAAIAKDFEATN